MVGLLITKLRKWLVFADISVSHGSVATYARCGGTFNIHLTANLHVKNFRKSVKI